MSQSEDFRFNVYGDPHRLFVQAMMCRGVIDSKEFKPLFDLCLKRCKIPPPPSSKVVDFQKHFLTAINDRIGQSCSLKIIKAFDESQPGKVSVLMLANQIDRSREMTKLTIKSMVTFSPPEMEFFQLLVDKILMDPMREISQNQALNLGSGVKSKKIFAQESEAIVKKLLDHKWITTDPNQSKIRLSTRFIYEMEPFLRENYPSQVGKCGKCSKFVVRSLLCRNSACKMQYHAYCASAMKYRCDKNGCEIPQVREAPEESDDENESMDSDEDRGGRPKAGDKRRRITQNFSDTDESD